MKYIKGGWYFTGRPSHHPMFRKMTTCSSLRKATSSRKPSLKQKTSISTSTNSVFQPNGVEMKQVFDKYDTNKDGKISRDEYKLALKTLGKGAKAEDEAVKAFEVMDSDGDGSIDFKEFMEVLTMGGGVKESDLQRAFREFDLDGNGKISPEELQVVQRKLGERCSLESCRKMVRAVDKDGDGLINMDEFMMMMTRTLKHP